MGMTLYSYFRSSASWRVRIALALKGLPVSYCGVHLVRNEQMHEPLLGPAHQLPALVLESGQRLTQSLAILEYLEEVHPQPPLLPSDGLARAYVRSLAQDVAVDIHPLQNLRVLRYLMEPLLLPEDAKTTWAQHWITRGLAVVDQRLGTEGFFTGQFCLGDQPGYADCALIPQLYNAERFGVSLEPFAALRAVKAACERHTAFTSTHPSHAPDAPDAPAAQ